MLEDQVRILIINKSYLKKIKWLFHWMNESQSQVIVNWEDMSENGDLWEVLDKDILVVSKNDLYPIIIFWRLGRYSW